MDNGMQLPPWMSYLTEQMDRRFAELGERLDKMVTNDTFRDERNRVNAELKRIEQDISDVQSDLRAESNARVTSELASTNRLREAERRTDEQRRARNWQWFAIFASPTAAILITLLINKVVQP